jgi:hypothetical protein
MPRKAKCPKCKQKVQTRIREGQETLWPHGQTLRRPNDEWDVEWCMGSTKPPAPESQD